MGLGKNIMLKNGDGEEYQVVVNFIHPYVCLSTPIYFRYYCVFTTDIRLAIDERHYFYFSYLLCRYKWSTRVRVRSSTKPGIYTPVIMGNSTRLGKPQKKYFFVMTVSLRGGGKLFLFSYIFTFKNFVYF